MPSDARCHQRRSIRLKGYDYTTVGAYFVTICTQNHICLFGDISNNEMVLNDAGQTIQSVWSELTQHYPGVDIDTFIVMPNHVHGLIILTDVGASPRGRPKTGQAQGPAPTTLSLPDVVHRFKSLTTTRYRHGVTSNGWQPFPGRLWQRSYYERIIRDDDELRLIRSYIVYNPAQWEKDPEYPGVQ